MPFIEITPMKPAKADETGVKVSVGKSWGLSFSLSGDALAILGPAAERARVAIDWDPALPRVRISAAPDGPFVLHKPALGSERHRILRIGKRPDLPEEKFSGLACTWETDGSGIIIVDLPREFRRTSSQPRNANVPSNSNTQPRQTQVTLPSVGTRSKERV